MFTQGHLDRGHQDKYRGRRREKRLVSSEGREEEYELKTDTEVHITVRRPTQSFSPCLNKLHACNSRRYNDICLDSHLDST